MRRPLLLWCLPMLLALASLWPPDFGAAGSSAPAARPADAAPAVAWPSPPPLDSLAIRVTRDHPREVIYTDKGAGHLAVECVGPDTRSYHGFSIAMHEILDGWALRLEGGAEIGAATTAEAMVYPDRLVRMHRLPGGAAVTETVTLFDRVGGLRIVYDGVPAGGFAFVPRVDMRFLWHVQRPAYVTEWRDGVLLVARADRTAPADGERWPAWLAVAVSGADEFAAAGRYLETVYPKDAARRAMERATPWEPGAVRGRIPERAQSGTVEVVVATGAGADAALGAAHRLRAEGDALAAARAARLSGLLARAHVATGVPRDDRALAWARLSMDALVMDARGPGIYAGFYWFVTYWGRDEFISLPGACLVDGDFATAQAILRSFAAFQLTDPASPRQGRLPNIVDQANLQYAGVDGTWWFVRALDELWRRSGDRAFACEMAPVVFAAVDGALAHAVDGDGFLTHGDGETWMDAGGEQRPYTPRGDRAVEVQALFHRGLLTAARLARACGGREADAARYQAAADRLAASFRARFWVDGRLADHLNRDGTPDAQVRPNGLIAVLASPTLFTEKERAAIAAETGARLVKPWGVQSLVEDDPDFKPKHLDLASHYYDAAYHNGDVWLWLSGPYVSALPEPAAGFGQTRLLLDEILDEGAAGTLQEIRDGARAASNDEFGGATSQAWSLAELLRTVVDDYLGLEVDLTADSPRVEVRPSLPDAWPRLTARVRIGAHDCLITAARQGAGADAKVKVTLAAEPPLPKGWRVRLGS